MERRAYIPVVVICAAAIAGGLFASQAAAAFFYRTRPDLVERVPALGTAAGTAIVILLAAVWSRRAFGRNGIHAAGAIVLPAVVLLAVFGRPFPDAGWSLLVLAAALLGMAVSSRALIKEPGSSLTGVLQGRNWPALIAGAISLAVYLRTMAPSIVEGDSAEFQTVAHTLGIAHPTGYPLYVLLAKAVTFLPFGDVAYRVNLLSALSSALAVYVVVLAAHRLCKDVKFSFLAGLTLAFTPVFWSQAVIAEVYGLNALIVALILYLLLAYGERFERGARPQVGWLWLAFGAGLAHHRMVLLLAPALLAFLLLYQRPLLDIPRRAAIAGAFVLAPLAFYAYIPLRWATEYGQDIDWQRFQGHVLASGYQFALQANSLFEDPARYLFVLDLLRTQLSVPALVAGCAGLVAIFPRRRRSALLLSLALVVFALFPVAYHVPDAAVFAIPAILVLCVLLAPGLAAISGFVNKVLLRAGSNSAGFMVAVAALLPAYLLAAGFAPSDMSRATKLARWGEAALAQDLPAGAVVVSDMPRNSALRYQFGVVAPERDLKTVMPDSEPDAIRMISEILASGHPVYLARFVPGLENYRLDAPGPLVLVQRGNGATSSGPASFPLAPGIALTSFESGPPTTRAGEEWPLRLVWHNDTKLSDSYYVHLRLLDEQGKSAFAAKPGVPVQGMYPTWAWPAHALVSDYRQLSFPSDLQPGAYQVQVGLGGAFRRPEAWRSLGVVSIDPPTQPAPTRPMLAVFGDSLALTGFEVDEAARTDGVLKATLAWDKINGGPREPLKIELELAEGDRIVAGVSTALWSNAGESWAQPAALPLGGSLQPGTYRMLVRLTSGAGRPLPVKNGWAAGSQPQMTLTEVTVAPPRSEALTNLENKVILLRHDLEANQIAPGGRLRLALRWQAAAKIDADYTVFVHLLDVNGKVRAQVDAYPLGGLRPTSQWRAGEIVDDPYELALPADLAAGDYQVEVGMYSASDMQRLQVIDAEENPVDDRILIGPVGVPTK